MPEFKEVWRHLLAGRTPEGHEVLFSIKQGAEGTQVEVTPLRAILARRADNRVLLSRLTPDMEANMYFLITQVGSHVPLPLPFLWQNYGCISFAESA